MPTDEIMLATLDDPADQRVPVTVEQQALYLRTLAATGSHQRAAETAHPGVKPASAAHYFTLLSRRDPDFARMRREALVQSQGELETVIYDHALNGWEEPVYQGGVQVGTVQKWDHKLMVTVARRNGRLIGDDSWEEKKTVTHEGGQTVEHKVSFRDLPKEERDRILADRRKAQGIIDATSTESKP